MAESIRTVSYTHLIVYSLMTSGINLEDLKKNMNHVDIKSVMEKLNIEIKIENRDTIILIDGKEIDEQKIQSAKSSVAVSEISKVADNKNFYAFGKKIIDQFKEKYNVIVSGRDLMKIYPELDYHIFIIASLDERIHRKCIQYNGKCDEEEVRRNILERDKLQDCLLYTSGGTSNKKTLGVFPGVHFYFRLNFLILLFCHVILQLFQIPYLLHILTFHQ